MADRKLPPPETVGEFYLAAILEELKALRDDPQSQDNGADIDIVQVKEPAKTDKSTKRTWRNRS